MASVNILGPVLLAFTLYISSPCVFSQVLIKGKATDQQKAPLPYANIYATQLGDSVIISYAISKADGSYELIVDASDTGSDSLCIHASYVGFKTLKKIVVNKDQMLDFLFEEYSTELKELVINSPSGIKKSNDTLSYNVETFKNQSDLVIADVLNRLPGIDVDKEGRIFYQGKPIQKYYIEGLDLLEGRYNLANNSLPADAVSTIQILENHQPIRVLEGEVFSNRASLNIKLKNSVTCTGIANLSLGYKPLLWSVNVSPMLFKKKQQMISTYQANNIGKDVSRQLKVLTSKDLSQQSEYDKEIHDWINIQALVSPPFREERWLNNNVHLVTSNYLVKLRDKYDFKIDASYINDYQQQTGGTQTIFFMPLDTINIVETKRNRLFLSSFRGGVTLEGNNQKNYLRNRTEFGKQWDTKQGYLQGLMASTTQHLQTPFTSLSNALEILTPVGKKLISFHSNLYFTDTHQELLLEPGVFEELINDGEDYVSTQQDLSLRHINTENSFGFRQAIKRFSLGTKVGLRYQQQNLKSTLNKNEYGIEEVLPIQFMNSILFSKVIPYVEQEVQFERGSTQLELRVPLKYNMFTVHNELITTTSITKRFTIEPYFSIRHKLNEVWQTSLSVTQAIRFGQLNRMYTGYLVTGYRNIQRNTDVLPQTTSQTLSCDVFYRDVLNSVFFNASYSFSMGENNLLWSTTVDPLGASTLEAVEKENSYNVHVIMGSFSKLFTSIKTSVSLEPSFTSTSNYQILNDQISEVQNNSWYVKVKTYSEVAKWLILKYSGTANLYSSQVQSQKFENIQMQQHQAEVIIFTAKNQYIQFDTEFFSTSPSSHQKQNLFSNIKYTYSIERTRIDMELAWNNVLNTRWYKTISADSFNYISDTYLLRPTQVLFSIKFRL